MLNADSVFDALSNSVTFNGTVNGGYNLTVGTESSSTSANFNASVGNLTNLVSVKVYGNTTTGGELSVINTSSLQKYVGTFVLGSNTSIKSSDGKIDFDSTVDGSYSLTVSALGSVSFGDLIGSSDALETLSVIGGVIECAGTGSSVGVSTTINISSSKYIHIFGADFISGGAQTLKAEEAVRFTASGKNGKWSAGSNNIQLLDTDLFIDSADYATSLLSSLSCHSLYFYAGTLSVQGVTILTDSDFVVFGSSYEETDPRYLNSNTRFSFYGKSSLIYSSIASSYSAEFDSLNGTVFNIGGNFYINGADLKALGSGLSVVLPDNSESI